MKCCFAIAMIFTIVISGCSDEGSDYQYDEIYIQKFEKYVKNKDGKWVSDENLAIATMELNASIDYRHATFRDHFGKGYPIDYHYQYSPFAVEVVYLPGDQVVFENIFEGGYLVKTSIDDGERHMEIDYTIEDDKLKTVVTNDLKENIEYVDSYYYSGDHISLMVRKDGATGLFYYKNSFTRNSKDQLEFVDYYDEQDKKFATSTFTYDTQGRVTRIETVGDGPTRIKDYRYDGDGNILKVSNGKSFPEDVSTNVESYGLGLSSKIINYRSQTPYSKIELDVKRKY